MGKPIFNDEFKRDAVAQITERGHPVAEASERLGVSQHSLYAWKRQLARVVSGDTSKDAGIRQLKRELARVTEGRDILKKPTKHAMKHVRTCSITSRYSKTLYASTPGTGCCHPAQFEREQILKAKGV